jgi:hypothetical protein
LSGNRVNQSGLGQIFAAAFLQTIAVFLKKISKLLELGMSLMPCVRGSFAEAARNAALIKAQGRGKT